MSRPRGGRDRSGEGGAVRTESIWLDTGLIAAGIGVFLAGAALRTEALFALGGGLIGIGAGRLFRRRRLRQENPGGLCDRLH